MRDLFDQIIAEGEPAILRMIAEGQQEGVTLDFKQKSNASTGEPTKEDRRVLGQALSAFSNSMGGLLIWGIEARKNEDGVDCAVAEKPITDIARFKADVVRLLSQAIMPRHEGIFVEAIPSAWSSGSGYLAILIERSERRPHRSEFGEKQYFKRVGDSSIAMEHNDIEDSFKRMTVPELVVKCSLRNGIVGMEGSRQPVIATIMMDMLLVNCSSVSARFPYFALEEPDGVIWVMMDQRAGIHPRMVEGLTYFDAPADCVIHPDTSVVIAVLRLQTPVTVDRQRQVVRVPSDHIFRFRYRIGCLDSRQKSDEIEIGAEVIVRAISNGVLD